MIKRTIFGIAFLFSLSLNSAFGQTAAQIKEQYGQPIEAFSVSEKIWMTPEYTVDGRVCKMRLYPKKISAKTNYLTSTLDYRELKEVLDKIAPPKMRGKRQEMFNLTVYLGQISNTLSNYENFGFSFLASVHLSIAKTTPPETATSEDSETADVPKLDDEMDIPRDAEIATITWTGRTCANK